MEIKIHADATAMGQDSADRAATILRDALTRQASARIVVATGASQFQVLQALTSQSGIDWSRVDGFHLDEYVGLDASHPASFCGYLQKRFVSLVPLRSFTYLNGMEVPERELRRAGALLKVAPIDLALVGIGENGHLAFNDPPADFATKEPYLLVELDEACRQQQVGEGWFASLADVPTQAMSMSVQQILASKHIICSVPDQRKAFAVKQAVEGPVSPQVPASILQTHPQTVLNLDRASASLLAKLVH